MSDIYNTLVQIRYPKITTATVKDVSKLLKGENRISLLSWLLIQKSRLIATELEELEGSVLEDKLLEYYSGFGVCTDKQFLLGNCTWQEQLSTLKLLLNFINCMYIEPSTVHHSQKAHITDILQVCTNEDSNAGTSNMQSNISYLESLQYFNNLKEYVDEHAELVFNYESQNEKRTGETEAQRTEEEKEINETDSYLLFNTNMNKFIEVFSNIESQSIANARGANSNLHSMDNDIKEMCSNFSSLTEFLQAKEEISNADIPKGLNKITTPLNEVVEDIASSSKEVLNIYKT